MSTAEYLEAKILTATPHQLHLMVIDAAIRQAIIAEDALRQNKIETAQRASSKGRQLVAELIGGLDPARAPEVVENLRSLFLFVHRKLTEAESRRDPASAADALTTLRMHRETWLLLGEQLREEEQSSAQLVREHESTASGRFSWSS